ncbi:MULTISPECIES: tRNA lysidine(34) synthetase TilS [Pseudoalteromonas]|uniref:tRNA(Ile)-lysidine synthase n=1 Tax=Pseudoalteromonas amylolytica TaxID=1859457 RepID=A0A1S1MVF4_9GAMM|nr:MULTISPECIES: tRNA lysidine(34) synthetase TilS [Pseudoalteromonas]OHU87467.1 tRNA lysidine(34) synthetase TilS [Pseudoalteromonas sp. JW3]OHU90909.1 tRNA lysidine(34) synthetase TilS [Pseudoalteromonas amylolytica]
MKDTTLYKQFLSAVDALNPNRRPMSVALSGGVDSVVLLHLCHMLRTEQPECMVEAIYIDHGLSADSPMWQQFCQRLCQSLHIEFKATSVLVEQKARHSLESQAREARYAALDKLAATGGVLVLGQHADDQLETFFLRLKRGSGLTGLAAMRPSILLESGRQCIRPLLNVSRQDIEAFAKTFAISHIEDHSNRDDRFDRNFLRNQVLPLLKSRFKGFVNSALRSIELLQQQQLLIEEITVQDLQLCQTAERTLDLVALAKLSQARQANVVRAWLQSHNLKMPAKVVLSQLLHQAFTSKQDAQLSISLGHAEIKRYRQHLYVVTPQIIPTSQIITHSRCVKIDDSNIITPHLGRGVRLPKGDEQVSVQFGRMNERIRPLNKPGRNTVRHWLKEAGVPSWQRDHVPLIFYNEQLVQVVGFYLEHTLFDAQQGIQWEVTKSE